MAEQSLQAQILAGTTAISPISSSNTKQSSNWFISEIQHMMFSFGDSEKPSLESAALVEEIVRSQLACLLFKASEAAVMRNGRFISLEDFLFLLRRDKTKLRRLLKFMQLKDMNKQILAAKAVDSEDVSIEQTSQIDLVTSPSAPLMKRVKICRDFLTNIDSTGDLVSLVSDTSADETKMDRLLRADIQSRSIDNQKYAEYHESRQISLNPGNKKYKLQRFRDWFMTGLSLDMKPNALAMEVLGYFANELVAQIVDLALIVKNDKNRCVRDVIASSMPYVYTNPMKISSPTTPTLKREIPLASPNILSPTSQDITKPLFLPQSQKRAKKRKKYSASSGIDTMCIQPSDIQEAMRRYNSHIGPFAPFEKPAHLVMNHALLCV